MIVKKIEEIEAFTGQEGTQIKQIFSPSEIDNSIRYSIAHCTINPGNNSKPHTMKTSEMYYIMQGNGVMHVDEEQKQVTRNDIIFVPPMSRQFLEIRRCITWVYLYGFIIIFHCAFCISKFCH